MCFKLLGRHVCMNKSWLLGIKRRGQKRFGTQAYLVVSIFVESGRGGWTPKRESCCRDPN